MKARTFIYALPTLGVLLGTATWIAARQNPNPPSIRVSVEMVQLDVAVTDNKGKYISGLHPADFTVAEDGISQNMAMFAEGDNAPRKLADLPAGVKPVPATLPNGATASRSLSADDASPDSPLAGASVYILFDTSNYMYHGFVFAQDAISDFVRSLQGPDRIAIYSYSRDLYRASQLSPDRMQTLRGVRAAVAGDNAAMYDAILLTLRDIGKLTGRRVIVVFSNGPDNASVAPPEDVEELAQSEGVAIYMISTRQAEQDPLSSKVFARISSSTGGSLYFAKNWTEEKDAFAAIRNDLTHLYTLYYYPQPNPNRGWRAISVKLKGPGLNKYRLRARSGYRPLPTAQQDLGTPAAGN